MRGLVRYILLVVHGVHGCLCLSFIGKADETETAAAQSVMVLDDNLRRVNRCSSVQEKNQVKAQSGPPTASSIVPY
jgi:hypothetical protein